MTDQQERASHPEDPALTALRASEEHYRNLVELSPQVPWTADAAGDILELHPRWRELTGDARQKLELEEWLRSVHPQDQPQLRESWNTALRSGTRFEAEFRLRVAGGEFRWMRSCASPRRDAAGAVVRWYGSVEDIHERRTAVDALRRREALYRATIETMAESVIVLDATGKVLTLNPAFAAMHGYDSLPEAFASLWQFSQDVEAYDAQGNRIGRQDWPGNRAMRGETVNRLTLRSVNRVTGRSFFGSYSAVPVFAAGELAYVVITIHDLTELLASQEAQRRQAHLLDTVEQAVIVTDLDGTITYWNGHAERLYGWPAAEVLGRDIVDVTPASTSREQAVAIMEGLGRGESWAGECMVRRRDGTQFPAWVTNTPIRDEGGTLVSIIGISTDLSAQKQVEAALRETEERLRQRVAELAEADRQKDEFLALLSHELRNPLAGIASSVYLLQRIGSQAPRPQELCRLIERQTRYLSRLLEDLLDVTRLTRGLIELRRETMDLRQVLRHATQATQPLFNSRDHHVRLNLPPEPLLVEGDPVRLEQVLVNLLTNAAKYTDERGQIEITAAHEAGDVVVRVRDNGLGIAPDLLPRVFELFTQADRSHARTHGGLGIGLTLVRRIVELHGGTVLARSEGLGHGSEFTVRLPVSAAEADSPAPSASEGAVAGLRVLVIDDNPDAADTLREILELEGHLVQVAHSGPSGVRTAAEFLADVILCDLGLPGMDGYAVARELQARGLLTAARLIAVTGFGQPEDRRRTAEAGFHAHVTKPADPEEILRLIAGLTT